jgi:hypothetical protein
LKDNIIKKVLIFLTWGLTLTAMFLLGTYVYENENTFLETSDKKYISYDNDLDGVKAMYLVLDDLGYNVKRFEKPARFLKNYKDYTMILYSPDYNMLANNNEKTYLFKWVEEGNNLVIVDKDFFLKIFFEENKEMILKNMKDGEPNHFLYGDGQIILITNPDKYTNLGLRKIDPGIEFIRNIEELKKKKILFNEFYHNLGDQGSIWDMFSTSGQIILIQILLGIVTIIFIKSRKFGKEIKVSSSIKRRRNDKIYTLASIYKRGKHIDSMLKQYVIDFEIDLIKFLELDKMENYNREILIETAKRNKVLIELDIPETIIAYSQYFNGKEMKNSEIIKIVKRIENAKKRFIL